MIRIGICLALVAVSSAARADDGAASIAAGGLVPRRESRVTMAKEVLRIGLKKIVVDYDFRNDTDEDVTTEVAFPVPPYDHGPMSAPVEAEPFTDFRLFIDGKPVAFQIEAKATLNSKDVTDILTADKIDVASFGHIVEQPPTRVGNRVPDFGRLPSAEQKRLIALGLISVDENGTDANWTVQLQYHWKQTFPAHSTVRIRHEYSPVEGFSGISSNEADSLLTGKPSRPYADLYLEGIPESERLPSFCVDKPILRTLSTAFDNTPQITREWVDFILTTANSWKQPIEDFTLIVERPKGEAGERTLISFCSPGPVERLDADHFQVHLTNFVPKAELHIGFFAVPAPSGDKAAQKK